LPTLEQALSTLGSKTWDAAQAMRELENPVTRRLVAAGLPETVMRKIEASVTTTGLLTAGLGLAGSGVDALQNDGVTAATTVVNGVPLLPLNGGDVLAIAHFLRSTS
jgi:hypothetical protein